MAAAAQQQRCKSTHFCRSGEWGVMPFHWYFTSALPRALLGAYPLMGLGFVLEPRMRPHVMLTVAYIVLYSFLPHKEVINSQSMLWHNYTAGCCLTIYVLRQTGELPCQGNTAASFVVISPKKHRRMQVFRAQFVLQLHRVHAGTPLVKYAA